MLRLRPICGHNSIRLSNEEGTIQLFDCANTWTYRFACIDVCSAKLFIQVVLLVEFLAVLRWEFGSEEQVFLEFVLGLILCVVKCPRHIIELIEHVSSLSESPVLSLMLPDHYSVVVKSVILQSQVLLSRVDNSLRCQGRLQPAGLIDILLLWNRSRCVPVLVVIDTILQASTPVCIKLKFPVLRINCSALCFLSDLFNIHPQVLVFLLLLGFKRLHLLHNAFWEDWCNGGFLFDNLFYVLLHLDVVFTNPLDGPRSQMWAALLVHLQLLIQFCHQLVPIFVLG